MAEARTLARLRPAAGCIVLFDFKLYVFLLKLGSPKLVSG